ncbi:hypothetical protein M427DRAFT_114811 [Gonapodya prolifera JEL478]|uniref:t-SNARE coiled-coil homology domain-containing protein n=1 Tax=Gonapodya prolifera (strain JEL478) TaxID=1344416 RepID=A0A139A485_GONPJ|nr:hypothetical protein M427DRAFT_114811 [Gonapodya prolifera JEL478]|eukprot:KXS11600.1 hypothetical protein M427DRAFT_114811 [Gonapodya prolifera JEL478]
MSDLDDYNDELTDLLNQIRDCLANEVSKLRGAERMEKCSYLRNRVQRAKNVLRSLTVESRGLPPEQKMSWDTKTRDYEEQVRQLQKDVEWAETSAERDDLGQKPMEQMNAREMTQAGIGIQGKSLASTARTKHVIEETINIGMEVNEALKRQTEEIKKIDDGMDQVGSNLKRAEKQLRVYMRRLATDKIFMVLIFLIVLGILGAILVNFLKPKVEAAIRDVQTNGIKIG